MLRTLALVVGIPTLLATLYFGGLASDIYVSEARFAIRSAKGGTGLSGLAAALASPVVSSGGQESMVVADYVHSADMLDQIQDALDIRQHYSHGTIDFLARLDSDATREELLAYFREHVDLVYDQTSGVVTVRTRAYEADMARQIARFIIDRSEVLVNEMSNRMEDDAIQTARAELDRAVENLRGASTGLTQFRNVNASLNPASESSALLQMVADLESKLIEARTELGEKSAYMREDSPEIVSLKNRISALTRQLGLEKGRVVGGGGQEMSALIEDYQPLALELEIAQQQYTSALASLELARREAQRKKQYLVTFITPNLPDEATEPRRLMKILEVMVFSLLTYAIGGLIWSATKDHIGK